MNASAERGSFWHREDGTAPVGLLIRYYFALKKITESEIDLDIYYSIGTVKD